MNIYLQFYYKIIIIIFFLFVSNSNKTYSQNEYNWILSKKLNGENNILSQNTVTGLYFDSVTGFLWIATQGGLVRYNGINAKRFDNKNVPYLLSSKIDGIFKNGDGSICALDKVGKVIRITSDSVSNYSKIDYTFVLPFLDRLILPPSNFIDNNKQKRLDLIENETVLTYSYINDTTEFYYTKNAFYFYVKNNIIKIPKEKLARKITLLFYYDKMIAISKDGTSFLINTITKKLNPLVRLPNNINFNYSIIYTNSINDQSYLLEKNKVYKIIITENSIDYKFIAALPEVPRNITSVLCFANNQSIAIGTKDDGLYLYKKAHFKSYIQKDNTSKKFVWGSTEVKGNTTTNEMAACTLINDSIIFTNSGNFINLKNDKLSKTSFLPEYYYCNVKDNNNVLYLSDYFNVRRYKYSFNKLTPLPPLDFKPLFFYYDSLAKKTWLIDTSGNFGYINKNKFVKLVNWNKSKLLISNIVRTGGKLLVHNSKEIFEFDEINNILKPIIEINNIVKITNVTQHNDYLRDLYLDKDDNLWITSYGFGIFIYNLKTKILLKPKLDNNDYLQYSHCIIDDGNDNFFIPTNNGLFYINRQNLIQVCKDSIANLFYYYYSINDGLSSNEFNGGIIPSYNKLTNGDLLLPSMYGLQHIYSNSIKADNSYPIFIDNISVGKKSYLFSNNMVFESNERSLIFNLNVPQWDNIKSPHIIYKIDNNNWVQLEAENQKILLTGLSGGDHTLIIKNQRDLQGKIFTTLTVSFKIKKQYYESSLFWLVNILLIILLIYLFSYFKNKKLSKSNLILNQKIQEKTSELSNTIVQLENIISELDISQIELTKLNNLNEMTSAILAHDIRSPLRFLGIVADKIYSKSEKLGDQDLTELSKKSRTYLQELYGFTETFLMWAKTSKLKEHPIEKQQLNIYEIVNNLAAYYAPLFSYKGNYFSTDIDKNLMLYTNKEMFNIILRNLIDNANKFTENGKIFVGAKKCNNTIQIIIKDTGKGIDLKLANNIFETKNYVFKEPNFGLGLIVIKELCHLLNINILINHTENNTGTKMVLEFKQENNLELN